MMLVSRVEIPIKVNGDNEDDRSSCLQLYTCYLCLLDCSIDALHRTLTTAVKYAKHRSYELSYCAAMS